MAIIIVVVIYMVLLVVIENYIRREVERRTIDFIEDREIADDTVRLFEQE